jgi:cell wall-associated NlpC family hydrolase
MRAKAGRFVTALVVATVFASVLIPQIAAADQLSDQQANAQQLESAIEANARKTDAIDEELNATQVELDNANAAISTADAKVAATETRQKHLRSLLVQRATITYRNSFEMNTIAGFDAPTALQFATREQYTNIAQQLDRKIASALARVDDELKTTRAEASQARADAAAKRDALQSTRAELADGDRKQRALLAQAQGNIAQLVEQAAAARAQAELASSQAHYTSLVNPATNTPHSTSATPTTAPTAATAAPAPTPTPTTLPPTASAPPPASNRGAIAVAYAYAQLGKPYCYAGVGPSCYDCSGLTMMAWAQAGVSMPHSSSAQGDMFPVVPVDQMQPGDLTIEYAGHSHVSIYIGNGMMITAPHTGDVIKIAPAFGDGWGFQYAVRPG